MTLAKLVKMARARLMTDWDHTARLVQTIHNGSLVSASAFTKIGRDKFIQDAMRENPYRAGEVQRPKPTMKLRLRDVRGALGV